MTHFTQSTRRTTMRAMKKQSETLGDRLTALVHWAGRADLLKKDGSVNNNKLAAAIEERFAGSTDQKISQATITRMLNGQVRVGSPDAIATLAAFFHVDANVVRGESPLPAIRSSQEFDDVATYLDDIERAKKQLGRLKQPALAQVIQLIDTFIALQDERYRAWADEQAKTLSDAYKNQSSQSPASRPKK